MNMIRILAVTALLAAPALAADNQSTYVGVITDTMCGTDHKAMKVAPDAKCVKECVGDAKTFQYALADGKNLYKLSDQDTPGRFAGLKVKVRGVLYAKTGILKVDKIEQITMTRR